MIACRADRAAPGARDEARSATTDVEAILRVTAAISPSISPYQGRLIPILDGDSNSKT